MTKIEAIIKPFKLDAVREALSAAGISGLTITPETRGFGRQKGQIEFYHGAEIICAFLPKVKIELIVPDAIIDRIVHVIQDIARTGNIGDGKIIISRLTEVVRVRNRGAWQRGHLRFELFMHQNAVKRRFMRSSSILPGRYAHHIPAFFVLKEHVLYFSMQSHFPSTSCLTFAHLIKIASQNPRS